MPRNPKNKNEFIAGLLPTVSLKHPESGLTINYFVDGRIQELRNVNDFMDKITCVDDDVWELLSPHAQNTITYEFYGDQAEQFYNETYKK
jgi:hypothetical protein